MWSAKLGFQLLGNAICTATVPVTLAEWVSGSVTGHASGAPQLQLKCRITILKKYWLIDFLTLSFVFVFVEDSRFRWELDVGMLRVLCSNEGDLAQEAQNAAWLRCIIAVWELHIGRCNQNASTRNTWRSKCITTQHTQHMRNTIENCKIEIGKHVSKLQCVNAEYACRAIIRKQLPGFESCRLWRLWWTFLVVAILAHAVTAAVKYDDDCPEVDRDISIRKRVCPKKHLKCLYRRSLSSLPVKASLKVVWTTLLRRTGA